MKWVILSLVASLMVVPMAAAAAWASASQTGPAAAAGSIDTIHPQAKNTAAGDLPTTTPEVPAAHAPPAVDAGHGHRNLGEVLPLWSCIPFAGMLLSIALFPLLAPDFWHHHFGKVSAFWAATLSIPFLLAFRSLALYEILHIIIVDYIPFIILLWSLYTVSGGILLRGSLRGTPLVNVILLLIGTALASWMGTTGAAMLMIRPFLRANAHRKDRTFMVV
ncbi:MAG: sodium:proton antiporter, partial [Desulfobacterales bacterium]